MCWYKEQTHFTHINEDVRRFRRGKIVFDHTTCTAAYIRAKSEKKKEEKEEKFTGRAHRNHWSPVQMLTPASFPCSLRFRLYPCFRLRLCLPSLLPGHTARAAGPRETFLLPWAPPRPKLTQPVRVAPRKANPTQAVRLGVAGPRRHLFQVAAPKYG